MIQSKLPNVGTTIFTRMSQLAAECGAINLSQGFPDFDGPPELREAVGRHIAAGHNQYAPMTGLPALREQVAKKIEQFYGRRVSADSEVTITPGGDRGDLQRDPGAGPSGRRSGGTRPVLRQLRTLRATRRRALRARAAGAAGLLHRLAAHGRGHRAAYPAGHHQYPAQPQRRADQPRGTGPPGRADSRPGYLPDQRRGLRAPGVRRCRPYQRAVPTSCIRAPSWSARSARPTTSPAGRPATWSRRRRSARSCARSTSRQLLWRHAAAMGIGTTWPAIPNICGNCPVSTRPSATCSATCCWTLASVSPVRRAPTSSAWTIRPSVRTWTTWPWPSG